MLYGYRYTKTLPWTLEVGSGSRNFIPGGYGSRKLQSTNAFHHPPKRLPIDVSDIRATTGHSPKEIFMPPLQPIDKRTPEVSKNENGAIVDHSRSSPSLVSHRQKTLLSIRNISPQNSIQAQTTHLSDSTPHE
ncbi:hypothetical protein M9H77_21910 [Catharanthus roseus]|uniref:Uncharacterized protein n=1 Tax=Catharanthus roseus TaxID=4058 RepID=A0ACC0AQ63_CATRO|nr:hypothetical protein M9H77_21910 [Catharanthus roseus]